MGVCMKANVGSSDARIRLGLAVVFFALAVVFNPLPFVALGAALVALVMAGTALTRSCPLYSVLGIDTTLRRIHHQ